MRAYLSVFRMRFKMEMQYRGAALGGIVCQMGFGFIYIALYRALYASKPQSIPFGDIVTYVWLQQSFFRLVIAADGELTEKVRTGAISYDLCRPLNWYGYYFARNTAQKLVGSGMRAVPFLLMACLVPADWRLGAPASPAALICALLALGMGLLCVCALDNITMAFTMKTLDPRGIASILSLLNITFSGNLLPLTLFPDRWQKIITLLPYAQTLDAPIRLYTGQQPLSNAPRIIAIQALWTLILVFFGLFLWKRHEKTLIVQGG